MNVTWELENSSSNKGLCVCEDLNKTVLKTGCFGKTGDHRLTGKNALGKPWAVPLPPLPEPHSDRLSSPVPTTLLNHYIGPKSHLSSITADKLLIFTFLLKGQDSVLLDMANTWLVELTIHGAKKNVVLSLVIILCITEVDL